MNRQQRRELNKKNISPRLKNNAAIKYCKPLENFIKQIETDSVMFDSFGNPLIDMNNHSVSERLARNEYPLQAALNLNIILEIAYQATYKSFVQFDIDKMKTYVDDFRRKILNRLKAGLSIELKDVEEAKAMHSMMVKVLTLAPCATVNDIKNRMNDLIEEHKAAKKQFPNFDEFRAWLN